MTCDVMTFVFLSFCGDVPSQLRRCLARMSEQQTSVWAGALTWSLHTGLTCLSSDKRRQMIFAARKK